MEAVSLFERSLDESIVQTRAEQVILTSMVKCSRLAELSAGDVVKKTSDPLL